MAHTCNPQPEKNAVFFLSKKGIHETGIGCFKNHKIYQVDPLNKLILFVCLLVVVISLSSISVQYQQGSWMSFDLDGLVTRLKA